MNKCHELMNAGLELHRIKNNWNIQEAISKYQEALKHVPEGGRLTYQGTGHSVTGGPIYEARYIHILGMLTMILAIPIMLLKFGQF